MKFVTNPERIQVLSSGGGTQSTAMAVLIYQGKLPKPDLLIMSDTGRECSVVIPYFEKHIRPLMERVGVVCRIVKKEEYTSDDIVAGKGTVVIPAFSEHGEGERPRLSRSRGFCSGKWKTDVIKRALTEMYPKRKFQSWLGITVDEIRRAKLETGKYEKLYPLISLRLNRDECIKLVEDFGLPTPPRSACWMCPNRHDSEWQWLKDNVPEDFEKAEAFERELQVIDDQLWLNTRGIPISEIDFEQDGGQEDLFRCENAGCFT